MPTHTLTRKDSSQHGSAPAVQAQQAQQAFHMPGTIVSRKNSPNMPTVGEDSSDSGGATAKAEALYAPVQASPAPGPGAEAAPAAQKPESSAAPDSAQSAESSSGPAAVPVAVRPPLPHVPSGVPFVRVSGEWKCIRRSQITLPIIQKRYLHPSILASLLVNALRDMQSLAISEGNVCCGQALPIAQVFRMLLFRALKLMRLLLLQTLS